MSEDDKTSKINYSSNSHKKQESSDDSEDREKRVGKVISGKAVERETPMRKKFFQSFAGDDAQSVGQYLMFEVVVPAAKNLISDAVSQGINRLLFGDGRPYTHSPNNVSQLTSKTNYTSYSSNKPKPQRELSYKARSQHSFGDILLETRGEAEMVLSTLYGMIEKFNAVTVADLYDTVDISSEFTDVKYGWYSLDGAHTKQVRGGWLLVLPSTVELN